MTLTMDSPRLRKFGEDNRGAIMVLGVFFACMMIGWMWMVVGLGDAMIWRDRSQEVADAVAYSDSALQAKAMNLISFINIVLLILGGVYLLLAALYNIMDLAYVVFGATDDDAGWTSCESKATQIEIAACVADIVGAGAPLHELSSEWCDPLASGAEEAHTALGKALGGLEDIMVDVMPGLSTFEDLVSYAAPWVGELEGIQVGQKYVDWGKKRMAIPISPTLIPGTTQPGEASSSSSSSSIEPTKYKAEDDSACESAKDIENCKEYSGDDKREGLPVEIPSDGMSILCKVATAKVMGLIMGGASSGSASTAMSQAGTGFSGGSGSTMMNDYCKPDSRGFFGGTFDEILSLMMQAWALNLFGGITNNDTCAHDNWDHERLGLCFSGYCFGGPGMCDYVFQIKDNNKDFWENPKDIGGPHTMVPYAGNGDDWMQTWSIVYTSDRPEQAERYVALSGMQSNSSGIFKAKPPDNSDTSAHLYLAQSEFYFECPRKWTDEECNGVADDDNLASYAMHWRARLRRLHGPKWVRAILGAMWVQDAFSMLSSGSFTNIGNVSSWVQGGSVQSAENATSVLQSKIGAIQSLYQGMQSALTSVQSDDHGGVINPNTLIVETIH